MQDLTASRELFDSFFFFSLRKNRQHDTAMIGHEIPVPPGLKEEPIDHAVDIIAKCFAEDKAQRYILFEDLTKAGKKEVNYEFNKEVFGQVIPDMVNNGARCLTVEGSGIASVWYVCPSCSFHLFFFLYL